MTYDPKLPLELKNIQTWFGSVIQQKMTNECNIQLLSPNGEPICDEAKRYIVSTADLPAQERMQLYNQSYWLRLLEALHEEFPLIVRLFGEQKFDQAIGIPYLDFAPPRHWSLNVLGDRLIDWIKQHYTSQDKTLILTSSTIDWAYQHIFLEKRLPIIDLRHYNDKKAHKLLQIPVCLQSTIKLFALPGHFMKFRQEMLSHPIEYWQTNDFPRLVKDKPYYFILYRAPSLNVEWEEVSKEEYLLLDLISTKATIEGACDTLQEMEGIDLDLVENQIFSWLQNWLIRGWICQIN
jgi:hypothetical protein